MNPDREATYRVALIDSTECAPRVRIFRFERPEAYDFAAGQFFALSLETADGPQAHYFSFAAAPGDAWIEVGTRMTGSAFKNALGALSPGDGVTISPPKGRLGASADAADVAFLVGGIGITPARSIMRDADQRGTGLRVALFYGNRDESCIPYRSELLEMSTRRPEVTVVNVLSEPAADWKGERGFIDAQLVRRYIEPDDDWQFIVAGPPPMIEPMKSVLDALGVSGQQRSIEVFSGYT